MTIHLGIDDQQRKAIAHGLAKLLANTYTLYLKTHNFHWNVEGPQFHTLHAMFEEQYIELAAAVDEIAERIRALGEYAPGSWHEFAKLGEIKESSERITAKDMTKQLLQDHETIARLCREMLPTADEANDDVSADLMTQRMTVHEKTAWMLRSLLA